MRSRPPFPAGTPALLLGIAIGLAGSLADNALGGFTLVAVLQVLLWTVGGLLVLAGVATSFTLGAGQRAEQTRAQERTRGQRSAARPMHPSAR